MYESLKKIKELPKDTKVYCGHEYTLSNSKFCLANDKNNKNLKDKITEIKNKLENDLPTIPSTIKDELDCNIFLRANNIKTFSKLRDLKDNF
jgi:hydroxyacylglutathione hydrolase